MTIELEETKILLLNFFILWSIPTPKYSSIVHLSCYRLSPSYRADYTSFAVPLCYALVVVLISKQNLNSQVVTQWVYVCVLSSFQSSIIHISGKQPKIS